MKRRNADCGKIRRPIKRNKITEGMYGSPTVLYLKFLILWAIVITADFMFMFRFEFLWPFWLLLRSVHDSFKYKGLAFSVLFVCIAITSDLVCLFFIPVHWLLFAASTYVWVQYVWHTDKGICLPTIVLWMLFVYLEAGIRWKENRHMPHLDLCRPFAAHCIGYPVVTLGFGFKSYVGYRMRQRKQREVAKENEFYMQLLQQALPQEDNVDELQNTPNGSVTNSGTIPVAQTIHTNSITSDHHQHNNSSSTVTTTTSTTTATSILSSSSSSSSSIHHNNNDERSVQIVGQMSSSSQTTATINQQTAIHQQMSNNNQHHNLNNSNSSSSSSRNAQNNNINSKLNNINSSSTTTTSTALSSPSTNSTSTTANGHIGNGLNGLTTSSSSHKSHRRSVDKDKNDANQINNLNSINNNNNNNSNSNSNIRSSTNNAAADHLYTNSANNITNNLTKLSNSYTNQINQMTSNHVQKDKDNWDGGSTTNHVMSSSSSSSSNISGKENNKSMANSNNFDMHNGNYNHSSDKKSQSNGNVLQYEVEEVTEPFERKEKGRRNRSKKDNSSSKDNHNSSHQQQGSNNNNNNNNNNNHHTHNNYQKDSNANSDSSSVSSSSSSSTNISNIASQFVTKICETCLRLEAEVKKYRAEVAHMKHIENELRQKLESNATTKTCLQAKQRECDDLEKRIQELNNQRQVDVMNIQNIERRLNEEKRQRQSLDAQLNNEKKARKLAEEKATRPECSEACKQRKQQIESEVKQLRRELKAIEEAKQAAEQQGRKCEQELRMFEAEVRNREAQQGTEVLMSALAAMQDKNNTLEKNLSAETRVKLDLFSALGEAKRQLEIKDSMLRSKDEEVLDLKAKIAQLLAVMPTDSLMSPPCSTGSSMLRMNDTPPLQGPSSPMMGLGPTHQQMMAAAHQLNSRGPSVVSVAASSSGITSVSTPSSVMTGTQSGVVVTQTSSNLDPNATAYTPKNSSLVGGAEA